MEVRWKNFKAYQDTGWVELAPLSVLIGANNTGKSSFYGPLLLLSQTLKSGSEANEQGLVLRGELIDAGSYLDLVSDHDLDKKIEFHFRFTDAELEASSRWPDQVEPKLHPVRLAIAFEKSEHEVVLSSYRIFDAKGTLLFSRRRNRVRGYSIGGEFWNYLKAEVVQEPFVRPLMERIRKQTPQNFLFDEYFSVFEVLNLSDMNSPEDFKKFRSLDALSDAYRYLLGQVNNALGHFLGDLCYLGPLRAAPKRFYEISGTPPISVGVRGEWAPEILFRSLNGPSFKSDVENWMKKFGFGDGLEFGGSDAEIFSLKLKQPDGRGAVNFADAGFGASQILPIVVESLSRDRHRGVVVAEQPEIHLNPKLQTLLADLVATLLEGNRTAIIETHSEHLLLRLRTLIALGELSANSVAIYYTELESGGARIRRIPLSADGGIVSQSWPSGFFAESLVQSFKLAAAQQSGDSA